MGGVAYIYFVTIVVLGSYLSYQYDLRVRRWRRHVLSIPYTVFQRMCERLLRYVSPLKTALFIIGDNRSHLRQKLGG